MTDLDIPFGSDLHLTVEMFKKAGIHHRYWHVNEGLHGEVLNHTSLVVGAEDDGPYVQYLFDIDGKLWRVEPTYSVGPGVPGSILVIAHTDNNCTNLEEA